MTVPITTPTGMPIITAMSLGDLDAVMALERRCFRDPWSRRMYQSDLTDNDVATYLVVRPAAPSNGPEMQRMLPSVLAYGGFWLFVDEAHLATIASHPDLRGCGLGLWLVLGLLDIAIERGATVATLEVRVSNLPAQRLYWKVGFRIVGKRAQYYRDGEDGLIMTTPPLASPAMQSLLNTARDDALGRLRQHLISPDQPCPDE